MGTSLDGKVQIGNGRWVTMLNGMSLDYCGYIITYDLIKHSLVCTVGPHQVTSHDVDQVCAMIDTWERCKDQPRYDVLVIFSAYTGDVRDGQPDYIPIQRRAVVWDERRGQWYAPDTNSYISHDRHVVAWTKERESKREALDGEAERLAALVNSFNAELTAWAYGLPVLLPPGYEQPLVKAVEQDHNEGTGRPNDE